MKSELTQSADSCWWLGIYCDTKNYKNPKSEIVIDTLWLISSIEQVDTIVVEPTTSSFMPGRSYIPAYFIFGNFNIPDSIGHNIELLLNVKLLDRQTGEVLEKRIVKIKGIYKKSKYLNYDV